MTEDYYPDFCNCSTKYLQQSVSKCRKSFVQDIVNRYGSAVVAGYSGAIKLNTFAINIFMTLGSCLSSYTAQNIGAGKAERIPLGFRTGLKLSVVASVPFVVLYVGFSRQMMGLFLNAESGAAITAGMEFLRIVAPWYLMIVVKLMTDGIIRGAGAMTYFVAATVPDLIIRILFALMFSRNYGSTGIWMAWPFGWIAATVLTLVFYRKSQKTVGRSSMEKNEHITIFRGYLSFMNCTEYFCRCSGNIENISMTGIYR